jgi:hypothetical protein
MWARAAISAPVATGQLDTPTALFAATRRFDVSNWDQQEDEMNSVERAAVTGLRLGSCNLVQVFDGVFDGLPKVDWAAACEITRMQPSALCNATHIGVAVPDTDPQADFGRWTLHLQRIAVRGLHGDSNAVLPYLYSEPQPVVRFVLEQRSSDGLCLLAADGGELIALARQVAP